MVMQRMRGGSGAAPGVADQLSGVSLSLQGSQNAGGTVQVQLTGVMALVLLAVVVFAAMKLK